MPDCKYFEELCSASLDGELTRAEKRELDKHLAECPACAAWLEDLKLMRTAWGDIKAPLPEELHEKIMEHIIDAMPAPTPPRKRTLPVFTIIPRLLPACCWRYLARLGIYLAGWKSASLRLLATLL